MIKISSILVVTEVGRVYQSLRAIFHCFWYPSGKKIFYQIIDQFIRTSLLFRIISAADILYSFLGTFLITLMHSHLMRFWLLQFLLA